MNKIIILNRKDSNIIHVFNNMVVKNISFPNIKTLFSLGMFMVVVFAGLYVVQVNLMTAETYFMQESQQKIKELARENKNLEVSFAQLNSLPSIEEKVNKLSFERAENVRYIQALDTLVTKR